MNTLERLETFVALCEYGSFTLAAKKLYRSQPTISHHIQQLEEQFGAPLIKREGRSVRLTVQGEILQEYALRILQLIRESEHKVRQSLLQQRQIMAIYVSNYISEHYLAEIMDDHYRIAPHNLVEIYSYCYGDLRKYLLEGQTNLAVMPIYPADHQLLEQFEATELFVEPLVLVVSKSHPFSRRRLLYPRDLDKQILLVPQSDYLSESIKQELLLVRSRNQYLQMSNFNIIKKSVMSGHGIAFLPYESVRADVEEDKLTIVKVSGLSMQRRNGVFTRKGAKLEPRERLFAEQVKQYFELRSGPPPLDYRSG